MSKEHEECRHCSHCKKCRANCFKNHQSQEVIKTDDKQTKKGKLNEGLSLSLTRHSSPDKPSGDFCLTDKIRVVLQEEDSPEEVDVIEVEDVKEFVLRLDEFILQEGVSVYGSNDEALAIVNSINRELKKLAGSKLV